MSSFLSRVQGYFGNSPNTKKLGASFGGRYIGVILKELIIEEPILLDLIFGSGFKNSLSKTAWSVTENWRFPAHKKSSVGNCYADLAITPTGSRTNCYGLVEIKFDDKEKDSNQFKDYRRISTKTGAKYILLSKYANGHPGVRPGEMVLLSDIARKIKSQQLDSKPVLKLFVSYVEELGLMFTPIHNKDVRQLLARFFKKAYGSDTGKIAARANILETIPNTFKALLNNQALAMAHVAEAIGALRRPGVDFRLHPYCKWIHEPLQKGESFWASDERISQNEKQALKEGGGLDVQSWVTLSLGSSRYLKFWCGTWFETIGSAFTCSYYTGISDAGIEYRPTSRETTRHSFPGRSYNEHALTRMYRAHLVQSIDAALASKPKGDAARALRKVKKRLGNTPPLSAAD